MKKGKFSVGCCFAGMGGFAQAFQNEGFKVNWAVEMDAKAAKMFSKNFPNSKIIIEDIKKINIIILSSANNAGTKFSIIDCSIISDCGLIKT